jgi:porphobilinogen synthase
METSAGASGKFPATRLRRLRRSPGMRELVRETSVSVRDLILPVFVRCGSGAARPIGSMPGQFQFTLECLPAEIEEITRLGIPAVILFGIPDAKDAHGSAAWRDDGVVQQAVRLFKKHAPELLVMTDLCFCEYTDHGHCGVLREGAGRMDVDNDATLILLGRQAVSHAQSGADVIAPSGMMDGMVQAVRGALDSAGFQDRAILSYAVKYASAFYGPFREAAESTPRSGDRASYQMDPANGAEALREAALDLAEGADLLMVKPALPYLDVIARVKQAHPEVPLCAYNVSGEYAMLHAAARSGWLDLERAAREVLVSIRRAGADMVISYFAKDCARWLQQPR